MRQERRQASRYAHFVVSGTISTPLNKTSRTIKCLPCALHGRAGRQAAAKHCPAVLGVPQNAMKFMGSDPPTRPKWRRSAAPGNIGSGQRRGWNRWEMPPWSFDKPVSLNCCDHIKPAGTLAPPKRCSRCARPVPGAWQATGTEPSVLAWRCFTNPATAFLIQWAVAVIIPRTHRTLFMTSLVR